MVEGFAPELGGTSPRCSTPSGAAPPAGRAAGSRAALRPPARSAGAGSSTQCPARAPGRRAGSSTPPATTSPTAGPGSRRAAPRRPRCRPARAPARRPCDRRGRPSCLSPVVAWPTGPRGRPRWDRVPAHLGAIGDVGTAVVRGDLDTQVQVGDDQPVPALLVTARRRLQRPSRHSRTSAMGTGRVRSRRLRTERVVLSSSSGDSGESRSIGASILATSWIAPATSRPRWHPRPPLDCRDEVLGQPTMRWPVSPR